MSGIPKTDSEIKGVSTDMILQHIEYVTNIVPKTGIVLSSSSAPVKCFKVTVTTTEVDKLLDHEIRAEDIHVRKFLNRHYKNY